jgi:hypothetical protein
MTMESTENKTAHYKSRKYRKIQNIKWELHTAEDYPRINDQIYLKKSYSQHKRFEQLQKLALQKLNVIQKLNTTYRTSSTSDKACGIQRTLRLWLHNAVNTPTICQTLSSECRDKRSQRRLGHRLSIFTALPTIPCCFALINSKKIHSRHILQCYS